MRLSVLAAAVSTALVLTLVGPSVATAARGSLTVGLVENSSVVRDDSEMFDVGVNGGAKEIATELHAALTAAGQALPANNSDVDFSDRGSEPTTVETGDQVLALGLPALGEAEHVGADTIILDGTAEKSKVAVQSLDAGVRALVYIESEGAPERFSFQLGGDVDSLVLNGDGSVKVLGSDGEPLANILAPWALDRSGREVPTYFEVDGLTLVQVVEHKNGEFDYGITADPSVWWWTATISMCTVEIASWVVPGKAAVIGAKLTKAAKTSAAARRAKKAIAELGGFGKAMKAVITYVKNKGGGLSATNKKRVKNILSSGKSVAVDVLGIGSCYKIYKQVS